MSRVKEIRKRWLNSEYGAGSTKYSADAAIEYLLTHIERMEPVVEAARGLPKIGDELLFEIHDFIIEQTGDGVFAAYFVDYFKDTGHALTTYDKAKEQ